ncbi:uncharacterized protein K460DRAFT_363708 [Cucurbitaria berberidis CBS 394.84]|uniref:Uncharacterized protein n=1 Tax=Cucurbitaria berberidis CBS 394.84 TaxID=1168544 RepID=A0A9P4LAY1_9PLEO|nr:uncharacterized protein K460DRAFT_363708 [Cucurbitaria berberidis CBS 394.84]KAF1847654.1 hypothetical protein K460DRAFT_363708 [Cucurbitaria berberidis CBS 394.84]
MSYSTATTPRTSIELAKSAITSSSASLASSSSSLKQPSKAKGIWESIKRHHQGMNEAYEAYYGQGNMSRSGKQQEIWEYKRGEYTKGGRN